MGELVYSTKLSLDGPWLLDAKALMEFDSIVARHWKILEERRLELLEKSFNEDKIDILKQTSSDEEYFEEEELYKQNHPIYSRSIRQVTIYYKNFRYSCENFEYALHEISLISNIPLGFIAYISSGEVDCQVALHNESILVISTNPEHVDQSRSLFTELGNWPRQYYAPWWQRWWEKLAKTGFRFYIYLAAFAFAVTFLSKLLRLNSNVLEAQRKTQILLEKGLNDSNMPDGIALLLQAQIMNRFSVQLYPTLFVLLGIIIFGIIFSIRPRIVIGIGKGSNHLRLWKGWLKFIGVVTLP